MQLCINEIWYNVIAMKYIIIALVIAFLIFVLGDLSEDMKYTVVYGIFILSLIYSVFAGRKSIVIRKIKYLLIWLLIFFMGFVVISYKDVLLNSRLVANLVPGYAVHDHKQLVFYVANDRHFYIRSNINGINIKFLLDTGASDIILTRQDAVKLGINLAALKYDKIYNTANGVVRAASVMLPEIMIGDWVFRDVRVSVNDADMDISLLGMSFLRLFSSYKFDNEKVVLTR